MNKLIRYLDEEHNIEIKNGCLINGVEFLQKFCLSNIDLHDYSGTVMKNNKLYITPKACEEISMSENVLDLLCALELKFICDKCDEIFSTRQKYILHINRKIPCDRSHLVCKDCGVQCCSTKSLTKHNKSKKHLKIINNIQQINNGTMNYSIIGSNGTINNTYIMVDYNDIKQLEKANLTEPEIKKLIAILKKTNSEELLRKLMFMINFDKTKPHLNNIIHENMKTKRCAVYEDGDWKSADLNKVSEELLNARGKDIKTIFEKYKLEFTTEEQKAILELIDRINSMPIKPDPPENPDNIDANEELEKSNASIKESLKNKKRWIEKIKLIIFDGSKRLGLKRPSGYQ